MSVDTGVWRAGGASVLGAAHKRRGLPNQDAYLAQPSESNAAELLIGVAAGHGGAEFVRSDVGAQLALQALRSALDWFPEEEAQLDDLKLDVVSIWQSMVAGHLKANPLQTSASVAADQQAAVRIYGSTLIAAAATQRHLLLLQLGDGDLVLGFPDGRLEMPLKDAEELPGEQTYSLCQTGAERFMRAELIARSPNGSWPQFVLIATDGVSKAFVDQDTFLTAVGEYRDITTAATDLNTVTRDLPDWLRAVSDNGSGDDATLCFATWSKPCDI